MDDEPDVAVWLFHFPDGKSGVARNFYRIEGPRIVINRSRSAPRPDHRPGGG